MNQDLCLTKTKLRSLAADGLLL